jgi:hypothetical protein
MFIKNLKLAIAVAIVILNVATVGTDSSLLRV